MIAAPPLSTTHPPFLSALRLQSAQPLAGCSKLRFVDLSHNVLTSTHGLEGAASFVSSTTIVTSTLCFALRYVGIPDITAAAA
jgi:Ran GTPase-activating protein (RanGAP) involved in mRNA processing and transport